ncbi:hypothetical protein JQC92_09415 [Shewanella sp. 202IG2-18]|uniref:hypothetical protein n=1 Tax=Parashewanella hymeniacidonis TaxID=2807618 RepID=UPI00195FC8BA|nr:hypothetical protein [Parashewanella hymeniacidonis]MBM7072244.1 hypothetical protein [Parashewanella hymeniacidonis]
MSMNNHPISGHPPQAQSYEQVPQGGNAQAHQVAPANQFQQTSMMYTQQFPYHYQQPTHTQVSPHHTAQSHFHGHDENGRVSPYASSYGSVSPIPNGYRSHSVSPVPFSQSLSSSPVPPQFQTQHGTSVMRQTSLPYRPVPTYSNVGQVMCESDIPQGQSLQQACTTVPDRNHWIRCKVDEFHQNISDISMQLTNNSCEQERVKEEMEVRYQQYLVDMQQLFSRQEQIALEQNMLTTKLQNTKATLDKFVNVLMIPSMGIFPPSPPPNPRRQHGPYTSRSRLTSAESNEPEQQVSLVGNANTATSLRQGTLASNSELRVADRTERQTVAEATTVSEMNDPSFEFDQRVGSPPATPAHKAKASSSKLQALAPISVADDLDSTFDATEFLANRTDGPEVTEVVEREKSDQRSREENGELISRASPTQELDLSELQNLNLSD